MSIIFVLTLLSTISCPTSACPEDTVLRFGQTERDYIDLPDGIMDNSTTRFSLCTWIKKRFSGSPAPRALNNNQNFALADNVNWNYVAGTYIDLDSVYNRDIGTWFHLCVTWSTLDSRARVYLDGHLIGTGDVTKRRKLEKGAQMTLGNCADAKISKNVFGGDLFQLNIYNRVLNAHEIKTISSDLCSREEERFASIKVLSWAEVLSNKRISGNVSEIRTGCKAIICRLKDIKEDLEDSQNITRQLKIHQGEINDTVLRGLQKMDYLDEKLTDVLDKLQTIEQEQRESEISRQQLNIKQGKNY